MILKIAIPPFFFPGSVITVFRSQPTQGMSNSHLCGFTDTALRTLYPSVAFNNEGWVMLENVVLPLGGLLTLSSQQSLTSVSLFWSEFKKTITFFNWNICILAYIYRRFHFFLRKHLYTFSYSKLHNVLNVDLDVRKYGYLTKWGVSVFPPIFGGFFLYGFC